MNVIDFFRSQLKYVHAHFRSLVAELTIEELHYVAGGNGNHIAFILWHCVRTEDNILHFVLQARKPIWNDNSWYEKLHLPEKGQGTGMSLAEAHALHIQDLALFMQYAEEVWQAYDDYLSKIQDDGASLSTKMVKVGPAGTLPAIEAIGQTCVTHFTMHLGEMAGLVGIMGKKGMDL